MNKTLLEIISTREDISDFLLHFTKGSKAKETLLEIIKSDAIIDVNNTGRICFTETPVTLLTDMFKVFERYYNPMYAPYGIVIKKNHLFNLGARPVIYGAPNEEDELSDKLKWRFEEYNPNAKDYSWLREWRLKQKRLQLSPDNCFIITKTKAKLVQIAFNQDYIVDIEFDGCVADGQFWGDATGVISRSFKGISFEDIQELEKMSKAELIKYIDSQSFDDVDRVGLGGFLI